MYEIIVFGSELCLFYEKNMALLIAFIFTLGIFITLAAGTRILNDREKRNPEYTNEKTNRKLREDATFYERFIKRGFDIFISFIGVVIFAPIAAIASLFVYIEDKGNVIFKQKRIGINKSYFNIHKIRSMKQNTGDIPTHRLNKETQDVKILKVGRFIRKTSIDELPQFLDVLRGRMSIVGPRPALWNQDDLIAERDKYGANDVRPGLTGMAQISGRDELEIYEKAKLDGQYCDAIKKGNFAGFLMDCKCFFGTIKVVLFSNGVLEGGTGALADSRRTKYSYTDNKSDAELIGNIGFTEPVSVDRNIKRKVLITGAGSYIGRSFIDYAKLYYEENFETDEIDVIDDAWREKDFSRYDVVYHVAGIAHADIGNVSDKTKQKYYKVNTDLAIDVAKKAKAEGVKEYIFMSSMIVYGESAPYGKKKIITQDTVPVPANVYGDSKLQADMAVRDLADENFKVIVIRSPMIYGKGSKGRYQTLTKLAKKILIFPDVDNQRSMLYIENLCELLCQLMLVKEVKQNSTVLLPQNVEWTRTSEMVKEIARAGGKRICTLGIIRPIVLLGGKMPGKIGRLVNKAFGNFVYIPSVSEYRGIDYNKTDLKESIVKTENKNNEDNIISGDGLVSNKVSIIMPAYNCEKFIQKSILSVQNQTYENWELIIVNDCSTDDTETIIKNSILDDDRIKYVANSSNQGAALARNKAVEMACGQYLAFLDSDDIWKPEKLQKQIEFMKDNNCYFTCTSYKKIDENDTELGKIVVAYNELDYEGLIRHCPGNSTVMYDARQLGKHIIPDMRKRNDYIMWLQIIKKAKLLFGIDAVLSSHRIRKGSISSNKLSLIKYHWRVYRNIEKMSIMTSIRNVMYWILKGILKIN